MGNGKKITEMEKKRSQERLEELFFPSHPPQISSVCHSLQSHICLRWSAKEAAAEQGSSLHINNILCPGLYFIWDMYIDLSTCISIGATCENYPQRREIFLCFYTGTALIRSHRASTSSVSERPRLRVHRIG